MRLARLELLNFGRHERLAVEPVAGVNGIVGDNGAGKSTLAAALRFAFTGDSGNAGTKEDDVRAGAGPRERAEVVATFARDDGGPLTVARVLRGGQSRLEVDGKPVARGEKAVNLALADLLGCDPAFFCEHAFVRQGTLTDFLDATDAVRVQSLQRLFGVDGAAAAYRACTEHLANLKVEDRAADLAAARDEVAALLDQHRALADELAGYEDVRDYDPQADPALLLPGRRRELDEAGRAADAAEELARRERARLAAAESALAAAEAEEGRTRGPVEAADAEQARVDALEVALKSQARAEAALRRARRETQECREAHLALKKSGPPAAPEGYVPPDDPLRADEEAVQQALWEAQRLVDALDGDVTECPTCGTPVASLAAQVEEAREALPELTDQVRRLKRSRAHDAALEGYARDLDGLWDDLTAATRRERALEFTPVAPEDAAFVEAWKAGKRAADAAHAEACRAGSAARMARHQAAVGLELATREARQAARRRDRLAAEVEDLARTAGDDADGAQARVERFKRRTRLVGERAALERQLAAARGRVEALAERVARSARLLEHERLVRAARDQLHRDAAPAVLSRRCMAEAVLEANRLLSACEATFRVCAGEDLNLRARLDDGDVELPARRLSGGQRVLLAACFRVACGILFAPGIRLLVLDEPTQFLDRRNVGCLGPLLDRLRQLSGARGLQCFVVTHELGLAPQFDATIRL